ncbi:UNVERIFIED_CONTAM: hypothetical protein RMT77_012490 [Armadillidium vulgare]
MGGVSVAVITKIVEIIFAIVIIGVYYGTDTIFKSKYDGEPLDIDSVDDCDYPGDNFGQFVIIGGVIMACIMLGLTMFIDKSKAFVMAVAAYNVIWMIFYFSAAIVILSYWSGDDDYYNLCTFNKINDNYTTLDGSKLNETVETMRAGGLTVGSFALFEDLILIINTAFLFMGSKK